MGGSGGLDVSMTPAAGDDAERARMPLFVVAAAGAGGVCDAGGSRKFKAGVVVVVVVVGRVQLWHTEVED
jgi:hypothetical protein